MYTLEDWIRHGDELRRPLLVSQELHESDSLTIVGGGLSGLSIAFRIGSARPDLPIKLLEKSNRLGGVIKTWRQGEWVCDISVNAVRPHPSFWRLVDDLGMEDSFNPSRESASSRWVILQSGKHRLSSSTIFKIGLFGFLRGLINSRKGSPSVYDILQNKEIADAITLGIVNDKAERVDANFLFPRLTGFGVNPPIGNRKMKKMITDSYPIFIPKKGSLASIDGGMEDIIHGLNDALSEMNNVDIIKEVNEKTPDEVSSAYGVPLSSIIWASGLPNREAGESSLSVFAVGYPKEEVNEVELGYGTLIPDPNIPISGILHESDIHSSDRAPDGHRLFRLMVPHTRWDGDDQTVRDALSNLIGFEAAPVIFQKIGERAIPRYPPGYLSSLLDHQERFSYAGWTASGVSVTHVVDEAERISELFMQ